MYILNKFRRKEVKMKKNFTRFMLALLVAGIISGAVINPKVPTVFAAEQTTVQEEQQNQQEAPQDGNEHSGHHG
jgi:uncharacterized membrane protein (DUF106 family)